MEEEIKLDDHERWQGTYKGVNFQIDKWKRGSLPEYDNGYTWNYYLIVKPREIIMSEPFKDFDPYVDYSKMYNDVEMHGGITYWCRNIGSSKFETDTIGCDYAHLWDHEHEGGNKLKENDVEWIKRDIQKTIDSLPADLIFTK